MNIHSRIMCLALGVVLLTFRVAAQPALELSAAETGRLGIEFTRPVTVAGGNADLALPARVTVPPMAMSAVSAAFDAEVERLWKASGETVAAGEPLARLRSPDLITAQGEFLRHHAALALQRSAHARDEALAAAGAIASKRLEETSTALREARVNAAASRARLQAIGMTDANLEALARSGRMHGSLDLLAPHDGYVLEKFAEVGQRVDAMTLIYRLARADRLWLEVRVPAERAVEFATGQQLFVDPAPAPATISHIGYDVDTTDNTILVRAGFAAAPAALRPGQFVMARWQGRGEHTFEVPPQAPFRHAGRDYVFVRTETGILARPVTVSSRTGERARISDGLDGNEQIVSAGTAALKALWLSLQEDR